MKTILVPTDLSKEADHAIEVAILMARQLKASIELVHILPSIYDQVYADTAALPKQGRKAFEEELILAKKEIEDLVQTYKVDDVPIKGIVKISSIFQDIADTIVKLDADLLVLGTKGDSGLHEFFIGSNAEKVVRRAHCPVITVRKKVIDFKLNQVVFATDFTDSAEPFLQTLQQWQKASGFTIHFLYVNTPLHFQTTGQIKARMQKFLKKYGEEVFITTIVDDYSELEGIKNYAQDIGADLIAMLTHGREGVDHILQGSLAEQLVNQASIPVLTYRIPAQ
jgi:nucleotide-binding universal stress UspA family protein